MDWSEHHILLIDDNPGDVRLFRRAFQETSPRTRLWSVPDGPPAMEFLRRSGSYHDAPRPSLVLLDLNLPSVQGRELLSEIKSCPQLRAIPVVVMTSSHATNEIRACYDQYANSFVVKPLEFRELVRVLHSLQDFWFATAQLPPVHAG